MPTPRTRPPRLLIGILAAISLLAVGVGLAMGAVVNQVDGAIPQANLFGTDTPTGADGTTSSPSPTVPPGSDIHGPLNILIAGQDMVKGVDFRQSPHSDAVMIMHIDATLTHAYLTSLPRDLLVPIPANAASGTPAHSSDKLTHAMAYGARVPGTTQENVAQGFALLARTVSDYTGIDHFDAGAVLSFDGMTRLVDVLGGIDIYVDHKTVSHQLGPDGKDAELMGGPFMTYPVGPTHLNGWQALDYARQRYSLPNGAYDRDRHHRQIIKALVTKLLDFDVVRFPLTPSFYVQYVSAVQDALTIDLRGHRLSEWIYALRNLKPENITLIGLPGGGVGSGTSYKGERLYPIEAGYFASVLEDRVGEFLAANPSLTAGQDPTLAAS
jgi:LCP family protein required for cell wall assembly